MYIIIYQYIIYYIKTNKIKKKSSYDHIGIPFFFN